MYEYIMQFREHYLHGIIEELRETARPLIPKTFDEIEPLEITNNIRIHPCVNVEKGSISAALLHATDVLELTLEGAEIQLKVENEVGREESLHEMRGNVRIALAIEGRVTDDRVQVGVDAASLTSDRITVTINTGHPLADEATLLDLMNRIVHRAYADGTIPPTEDMNGPAGSLPYTIDGIIRVENDDGGDASRKIRVTNAPGVDTFMLILPIEVWANVIPDIPDAPGAEEAHVQFTTDLQTTFVIDRQLDIAPAFVEMQISQGTRELANIVAINGEKILNDPQIGGALKDFVRERGEELIALFGDPRIETYTMDGITGLIRDLIRDYLQSDGRFIEFWGERHTRVLGRAPYHRAA